MTPSRLMPVIVMVATLVAFAACAPAGPAAGPQNEHAKPRFIPPLDLQQRALELFPEAYRELSTVGYENFGDDFVPAFVTVVVPDRHFETTLTPGLIETRVRRLRAQWEQEGWALCPEVEVGPAEDFAWQEWPDKRARRLTLRFHIGC